MNEDFQGAGEDSVDGEKLHTVMAHATAHLSAVRVDPTRLRRAQRRRRLSEGGVVAGVLSVALVAAGVVTHTGGPHPATYKGPAVTSPGPVSQSSTTSAKSDLVNPVGVAVYDSDDGSEGLALAAKVLTGTGQWETRQYCQTFATYRGLQKSTGLVFDLGAATRIAGATVSIGLPGADMEMWTADTSVTGMPDVRPGQPPAGFTKQASVNAATSTVVFTADHPITTRFVLVWFTHRLPAVPNPDRSIHCLHDDGNLYGDTITKAVFTRG
jgi:hypothetical protein